MHITQRGGSSSPGKETHMGGLLYPKGEGKPKKKMKHPESILHQKDGTCYLCLLLDGNDACYPVVHEHHIFEGSRRKASEAAGLKVYLCPAHHEFGQVSVHGPGRQQYIVDMLHQAAQAKYEETHTRKDWLQLMGKNYLEGEE